MRLLLRSLARNESTTVTNRTLKNDVKEIDDEDIDANTINEYLNILSGFSSSITRSHLPRLCVHLSASSRQ